MAICITISRSYSCNNSGWRPTLLHAYQRLSGVQVCASVLPLSDFKHKPCTCVELQTATEVHRVRLGNELIGSWQQTQDAETLVATINRYIALQQICRQGRRQGAAATTDVRAATADIGTAADKAADMFWSRWLISMLATLEALQTLWKSTFEMDPRYRLK